MFEGFTLAEQRKIEESRGWKPSYSALTYCTAEAVVIYRPPGFSEDIMGWEILDAERVTGAPDCVGRRQGKWGTYIMPGKDPSAKDAVLRCMVENFGKDFSGRVHFAGLIGPWLHKATMLGGEEAPVLHVLPEQGEQTPFQASLFTFDAAERSFDPQGVHGKSTKDIRWVPLGDLIDSQGQNPSYLYWVMIYEALVALMSEGDACGIRHYEPGDYPLSP